MFCSFKEMLEVFAEETLSVLVPQCSQYRAEAEMSFLQFWQEKGSLLQQERESANKIISKIEIIFFIFNYLQFTLNYTIAGQKYQEIK